MMPDGFTDDNTPNAVDLNELVGLVGNRYMRAGLSPPSQLHNAVKRWRGISVEEIMAVLDRHFDQHRRLYTSGSGDGFFYMVRSAIHKALEAKHRSRARADDDPERPRRRAGRVRKIHNASGFPDVIVDGGLAPRLLRDQGSNAERPSGLVGYEDAGEPIGEDDDPGEAV